MSMAPQSQHLFASDSIPYLCGPIFTGCGDAFPIRAEGNTTYIIAVALERLTDGLVAGHIPQNDGLIATSRRQGFAIRAEGNAGDYPQV